jgi:hypothetical protein
VQRINKFSFFNLGVLMKLRVIPVANEFDVSIGKSVLVGTFVHDRFNEYGLDYQSAVVGEKFKGLRISGVWGPADDFSATLEMKTNNSMWMYDPILNRSYPMFPTDFASMVKRSVMHQGVVTGDWEFVKKNMSLGIRLK